MEKTARGAVDSCSITLIITKAKGKVKVDQRGGLQL